MDALRSKHRHGKTTVRPARRLSIGLTFAIGLFVAVAANAAPIGTAPWDTVLRYYGQIGTKANLKLHHASITAIDNMLVSAGVYKFVQIVPNTGLDIQTFCFDPQIISHPVADIGYDIASLSQAPVNTVGQPPTFSPLQVQAMQRLWHNEIGMLTPTTALGTRAPAFQLAMWEIAWETNPGATGYGTWDVTAGDFYTSTLGPVVTDATAMLTALSLNTDETHLKALVSELDQDQVVYNLVPSPGAIVAGVLLIGMIAGETTRRHRRLRLFGI